MTIPSLRETREFIKNAPGWVLTGLAKIGGMNFRFNESLTSSDPRSFNFGAFLEDAQKNPNPRGKLSDNQKKWLKFAQYVTSGNREFNTAFSAIAILTYMKHPYAESRSGTNTISSEEIKKSYENLDNLILRAPSGDDKQVMLEVLHRYSAPRYPRRHDSKNFYDESYFNWKNGQIKLSDEMVKMNPNFDNLMSAIDDRLEGLTNLGLRVSDGDNTKEDDILQAFDRAYAAGIDSMNREKENHDDTNIKIPDRKAALKKYENIRQRLLNLVWRMNSAVNLHTYSTPQELKDKFKKIDKQLDDLELVSGVVKASRIATKKVQDMQSQKEYEARLLAEATKNRD